MPDLRKRVARKVINCAKPGTLDWQEICKTLLSEFQDQMAPSQSSVYVEVS
jgi:hypothetical protein